MTDLNTAFIREQLADAPLFRNYTDDELEQILAYFELRLFEDNTIIFNEGDRGDYVCIVIDGTIEIRKESISSKQTVIAKFGRGSIVGEMAVIDQFPRSSAAHVTSNSKILILSSEKFDQLLEDLPHLGIIFLREIARILSQRLRRTSGRFSDIF